jgi:hypothetical protein
MTVPTVQRCRDLLANAVGALPLVPFRVQWDEPSGSNIELRLPPSSWMIRPDPTKTRNWILAWTCDDLIFTGRAYWLVVTRYATGFPASFARMPVPEVSVRSDGSVSWNQQPVDPGDVIEFLSPIEGCSTSGGGSSTRRSSSTPPRNASPPSTYRPGC